MTQRSPADTTDQSVASEHWRCALLQSDKTIQDAIHSLDASALQIVLVVSAEGRLVGTVTDGDIRRGLLRGLTLASPMEVIINREPFVVPASVTSDTAFHLMRANKIGQLPRVDEEHRVIGLDVWDSVAAPDRRQPNTMIIMAGGRGARLWPHTETCPKPLLPIAGKPMLEHIIERARTEGFEHFVLAIHYLGEMIEEYFGDGLKWGVRIDYLRERSPLGTAGAIGLMHPRPSLPVVVSNGDVLTDIRYGELLDFHLRHHATATMAVRLHEWQHPFGVVRISGINIEGFEEKPISRSHISAGIYVLEPEALNVLLEGEHCDMPALFSRLQSAGNRTIVYPMHEPWLDVGGTDDYATAQKKSARSSS